MIDVQPDIKFIEEIKKSGNSDLSTCIQCGSCTAACGLSENEDRFPRKEMIWASWGMKDMLISDAALWMCHQCGDCTKTCPRGVKPGDVLSALRKLIMIEYARPKSLAQFLNKPAFLPLILLLPVIIISVILILAGTFTLPSGPVDYSEFFPHAWLNGSFSVLFLLTAIGLVISVRNFWNGLSVNKGKDRNLKLLLSGFFRVLPGIQILHASSGLLGIRFLTCGYFFFNTFDNILQLSPRIGESHKDCREPGWFVPGNRSIYYAYKTYSEKTREQQADKQ